jgi:hypothetical protein
MTAFSDHQPSVDLHAWYAPRGLFGSIGFQQKISVVILAVDVHADHHPAVVHLTERMKRVKLEDKHRCSTAMGQAGDVTGGRNGREGK